MWRGKQLNESLLKDSIGAEKFKPKSRTKAIFPWRLIKITSSSI